MNVVLDTNILVGAAITPKGPAGRIVAAWKASVFTLVLSPQLLEEVARALTYPRVRRYLAWSDDELAEFLRLLAHIALVVEPAAQIAVLERDPDDNRVLEAAVAGNCQYVVSNEGALLALGNYEGIEIVSAARFAGILGERQPEAGDL